MGGRTSSFFPAWTDYREQQPEQGCGTAAENVPGRGLGEFAGKGVAELIRRGVGCIHPDNEQSDTHNQKDDADDALHAHRFSM